MHQVLGFELNEYTGYRFKLLLRGCKRVLGTAPLREADTTREMFSFLHKSICLLLPIFRSKFPYPRICSSPIVVSNCVYIHSLKTIQFNQRELVVSLRSIPLSPLCSVNALRCHLRINHLHSRMSLPLFPFLRNDGHH